MMGKSGKLLKLLEATSGIEPEYTDLQSTFTAGFRGIFCTQIAKIPTDDH